ncbi:WbqC family protein [Rhodanobacter hydrolyticus]|uniref:WbqC family protein n=1 Tax=Rhodanobacter hydrolyticus TaxID=2250595 RepID=A0ABW8J997_9GAMM
MTGCSHRVAVIQSSYLPWKGYFDIMHDVDEFIFYDDVQFTKSDWRTRNRIKTSQGLQWLSVPAGPDIRRLICEVVLNDPAWQAKHWRSICQNYSKAPYFSVYREFFEDFYLGARWSSLSTMNQHLIRRIATDLLGITTAFRDSRELAAQGQRLDRLLDLLRKVNATAYVSGPAAKDYIDPAYFEELGIELSYKDYSDYPAYPQSHPPFEHAVSIIDLIFNTGPQAPEYIWGHRSKSVEVKSAHTRQA